MKNIKTKVIRDVKHPESYLRIQKKEDFITFAQETKYKDSRQGESVFFRRFMKQIGKKVAETTKIFSQHIELENKGYPKGFKNYDTYNPKYKSRNKRRS